MEDAERGTHRGRTARVLDSRLLTIDFAAHQSPPVLSNPVSSQMGIRGAAAPAQMILDPVFNPTKPIRHDEGARQLVAGAWRAPGAHWERAENVGHC